jgi:aspartokinase-like uncharacterized kinase
VPYQVVKIGGSILAPSSQNQSDQPQANWAEKLLRWQQQSMSDWQTIYIAGGGEFANEVRRQQIDWQLDDFASHQVCMALLSGTAELLSHRLGNLPIYQPSEFTTGKKSGFGDCVLSPEKIYEQCNLAHVPKDWSVTSDSLAAIFTTLSGAKKLVLVKSTDIPEVIEPSLQSLADVGLVDMYFPQAADSVPEILWVNLNASEVKPFAIKTKGNLRG